MTLKHLRRNHPHMPNLILAILRRYGPLSMNQLARKVGREAQGDKSMRGFSFVRPTRWEGLSDYFCAGISDLVSHGNIWIDDTKPKARVCLRSDPRPLPQKRSTIK